MKKTYRFLCLLLCLVLMLSIQAFASDAGREGSIQDEVVNGLNSINSDLLLNDTEKITKVVEKLFMVKEENYMQDKDIELTAFMHNPGKLSKSQRFFIDKVKLDKGLRKLESDTILWYRIVPKINDIVIGNNEAKVLVTENIFYEIDGTVAESEQGTEYEIKLINNNDKWLIAEVTSDDTFEQAYLEQGLDVQKMLKEANKKETDTDKNKEVEKKRLEVQDMIESLALTEVAYSRTKAKDYALKYSTSTVPTNTKFYTYSSDCQNFGSQCIWYGFGGQDTQTAIDAKLFPMVDQGTSGARSWYQTKIQYDCPTNWSWTGVEYFDDYMDQGGYDVVGPYGFEYSGVAWADVGDIIQVDWDSTGSWYDHTYVVSAVTGTLGSRTKSDIYVCAHTSRLNNTKLSLANSIAADYHRTIKVGGYMK